MNKYIIRISTILIIFCLHSVMVYSQGRNSVSANNNDISKLNKRIEKLFKKSSCYKTDQETKIFSVFFVATNKQFSREDFMDTTFLYNLEMTYFKQGIKDYLKAESYIYKDNVLIAKTEGLNIYCLDTYKESAYDYARVFLSKILELEIERAFYICLTPIGTIFAVDKSNEIYIFKPNNDTLQIYLLNDYLDEYWDEFNSYYQKTNP